MSTTLKTKRFSLEAKPAGTERNVNRSAGRVSENSVPVLIRLPNLSPDSPDQASKHETIGDDSTTSRSRDSSDSVPRSKIGKDKQKTMATTPRSQNDRSKALSNSGWQIVIGVCLVGFLGLAYALMTGGPSDDQPASPPEAPDGLFIEMPNDQGVKAGNIVVADEGALGNTLEQDAFSEFRGATTPTNEPESDFYRDTPKSTVEQPTFENEATNNRVREFNRDEPYRQRNGQFVESPSAPIENVIPKFRDEPTPEYPTTDPDTYVSPWELRPEWRTGERSNGPNDSHGSNRLEDRQPGMAKLQGVIEPPPYQNRERR